MVISCRSTKDDRRLHPAQQEKTIESAFKNCDLTFLKNVVLSREQLLFKNALERITLNDFDSSIVILKNLINISTDTFISLSSRKIFLNLLFYKSDWQQIIHYDSLFNRSLNDDDNVLQLAKAYSKIPYEDYIFSNEENEFDIDLSPTYTPIIPVLINGYVRNFWFDTGANYSVIASDIAAECGLIPIIFEKSKALTSTTRKVDIYPTYFKTLQLGNLIIKNHPAVILHDFDLKMKLFGSTKTTKIDGIIGWKAIQNMEVTIDYKNRKMSIIKPTKKKNIDNNLFWLSCPVIRVIGIDKQVLNFGLDLGSEKTSITNNIFNKINFDDIYQLTQQKTSAGGWIYFNSKMISYLPITVFNHTIEYFNIGTTFQLPSLFLNLDGILGNDLFLNSKIIIDISNNRFEFHPETK